MTRRIIGNLFAESLWARMAAAARRAAGKETPSPLDPRFMPADDVMDRLAALATLLRVFAEEGDFLWTPRAVAPERMADVPGVPRPLLITGARPTPSPGDLAWGDATEAAVAANDRRLAAKIQESLGCTLPAMFVVEDIARAVEAVRAASAASSAGTWIVKAVHSAAGRGRVGSRGADVDDAHRAGIARLLELHGAVIVEPWVPRIADFGGAGTVTDAGAEGITLHDLENTPRGDFRGIAFPTKSLQENEANAMRVVMETVGRALAERGYRGPFGIDSFRWKDTMGSERFHAMCEINARHTFGAVARAFAARIAAATGRSAAGPWQFRVGDEAAFVAARDATAAAAAAAPGAASAAGAAPAAGGAASSTGASSSATPAGPAKFIPLLIPGPPDGVAAWMIG